MKHKLQHDSGFSLLETLITLALMLMVSASALTALNYFQKSAASTNQKADMHRDMRAAMELMSQEIGQAGLLSFTSTTLSAAVTSNSNPQTVNLSSTTDIFVGEKLLIDIGSSQETVSVTAVTSASIAGIFTQSHASGAKVDAIGVFPQGIVYDTGLSTSTLSNGTRLELIGDLVGDGTLVYAQYDCDTVAGTLSRSSTPISAGAIGASDVLIQNVIANPGATPCFQYTTTTNSGFTFVTCVGATVSVQTAFRDPQTNAFVTMTKSFLNIAPRNVLAGLTNGQNSLTGRLQPTPPSVPLH